MPTITGISHIDLTVTDLDRSETWYSELLDMKRVLDGRNDAHHFDSRYLIHPDTLLILGLVRHDDIDGGDANGTAFDEHRVGLDHLSFNVASRSELDAWQDRVAERAIEHTPIAESAMWDVLVVRDPDNIQLEFFYMKPEAATLLG
jgi:catechol 2,3-dioxygenase-like lactoylglutathione lyase family enzyme